MTETEDRMTAGIKRANIMVIAASFGIMDTRATEAQRQQASYFQTLFSRVRDVLQEAAESVPSEAALALADAVAVPSTTEQESDQ